MKNTASLSILLLSAALISAPVLMIAPVYAHDGGPEAGSGASCGHEQLSDDQRELVRSAIENLHTDNKPIYDELHKLHQQRHNILAAPTFDKAAFLSVEEKIEQKRDQLAKNNAQIFASIADKLTPEEREHIAHIFGHHHNHGHHHGGWKHAGWEQGKKHKDWHHQDGAKDGMTDMQTAPSVENQATSPALDTTP